MRCMLAEAGGGSIVVPAQVQHAVQGVEQQLVADARRHAPSPAAAPRARRRRPRRLIDLPARVVVERERQHVGRAGDAHELLVQLATCVASPTRARDSSRSGGLQQRVRPRSWLRQERAKLATDRGVDRHASAATVESRTFDRLRVLQSRASWCAGPLRLWRRGRRLPRCSRCDARSRRVRDAAVVDAQQRLDHRAARPAPARASSGRTRRTARRAAASSTRSCTSASMRLAVGSGIARAALSTASAIITIATSLRPRLGAGVAVLRLADRRLVRLRTASCCVHAWW